MKRALVFDGLVFQVVPVGEEFEVAPALKWVDCADDVEPYKATESGGTVTKMPDPAPAPPEKSRGEMLEAALVKKGVVTLAEIEAEK